MRMRKAYWADVLDMAMHTRMGTRALELDNSPGL